MPSFTSKLDCKNCHSSFYITEDDAAFYQRLEVPPPTWCPECRHLRRHGHVNDYVFYTRPCDECGKKFVSSFPSTSEYRVICQSCWYSESRDDTAEGRDYDPHRPFFEQFDELMHAAPQMGIIGMNLENCDFCESVADCRNSYLISECSNCEDCFYGYWLQKTKVSLDNCYLHDCERCYEVSDSFNCYALRFSTSCQTCSDSIFLDHCIGCSQCAFCVNLRHAKFCIFNKQYSEAEYRKKLAELNLGSRDSIERLRVEFDEFVASQPRRHLEIELSENSVGDYVRNTKNCWRVYHCYDAEECSYGEHVWRGAKYCMDVNTAGRHAELLYETTNTNQGAYFSKFCRYCWGCRFTEYSNMCVNSSYLFGCVGLKANSRYCILNKQYSEEDYHQLVAQIKQNMLRDGEYGEFFPLSISLFGYNDSVSFDDRRLSKEEILAKGWKWESAKSGVYGSGTIATNSLGRSIQEVPDSICNEVLTCSECDRNYRIIRQELTFYRNEDIPLPVQCPDCRHRRRLARRNRKGFREIDCQDCGTPLETTLDPKSFRRIVCQACYLKAVY